MTQILIQAFGLIIFALVAGLVVVEIIKDLTRD
jgi:hypothetical protein